MPSLLVVSSRSESVPTGSSTGFTVGLPGVSQLDAAADVPPTFGDGDTLSLDVDDFFGVDRDLRLGFQSWIAMFTFPSTWQCAS